MFFKVMWIFKGESLAVVFRRTSEGYLEPHETSKIEYFAKIVIGFQPFNIFTEHDILDV